MGAARISRGLTNGENPCIVESVGMINLLPREDETRIRHAKLYIDVQC